jgi:flagellar biosynthesis protein FlhF
MKVKKYSGASLEKIRQVIVKELGEDAVIVNVKKLSPSGKLLSIGKKAKEGFEVIAAVEEPVNVDNLDLEKFNSSSAATGLNFDELLQIQKEHYRGIRNSIKMLDEKIAEVDERLEHNHLPRTEMPKEEIGKELANVHDNWRPLIAEAVKKVVKSGEPTDDDWHEALASIIPTAGGIMFRKAASSTPDIYVIAGPTGVGKTTTLAKLAAKCVLGENLNVGLITTDTFRVAAVDQLREYSSLLGVEVAVAFSREELELQLKNFYDKDVIFVDTPGRSQFDLQGIESIRQNLDGVPGLCVLLVAPAGVRSEDAESIYDNYKVLDPSALIISKTDEATCCDGITKLLDVSGLPVIYLTDGQRVPEDIHVASPGIVASMVMPFIECGEDIKIGNYSNHA